MENKVRRKHRYKENYVERVRTHNPLKVIALLLIAIAVVWCFIAALRAQLKESDNYISRALAARMLVLSDTDGNQQNGPMMPVHIYRHSLLYQLHGTVNWHIYTEKYSELNAKLVESTSV